jgi:transcriptional regulator
MLHAWQITMYIPSHFAAVDPALGVEIIEQHGFAALVTVHDGVPFATHLPLLFDRRGVHGTLVGHVARANPQWQQFELGQPVLAIFIGPHSYVSPTWYAPRPDNVPTWNYVAVHVRGRPRLVADGAPTLDVVQRLSTRYDSAGYQVDTDSESMKKLSRGIVAFEIEISEILTKLKLSQNRPAADRAEVTHRLAASDDRDAQAVAAWMARVRS